MEIPGENFDIWFEGVNHPPYPRTTLPTESEYVIIGGGMAGITSAYLLSKAGKKVVLLEKTTLGGYATSATTAFLTYTIDTEPQVLIKKFGIESARLILEAHKTAIDGVEAIIKEENIDCEFTRCTNYIYANSAKEEKHLIRLAKAYNQLGIAAEFKKEHVLKFNTFGYIAMPGHGKFHAIKYLTALAKAAVAHGAIIAENTEVLNVTDDMHVEIKDVGIIQAKKVISATYRPFKDPEHLAHLANMYTEYVLEYKLPKNMFAIGTYEDTRSPYNYFRIDARESFDRLIIGGNDHLSVAQGDKKANFDTMRAYTEGLFGKDNLQEARFWSGSMLETNTGLAFIGDWRGGNIFYMFGFSGNGMTYSYIAGKILIDTITGIENPYKKIYATDRKISWWKNLFS